MTVLSWDKPEKIMTTEEWQAISADGAPPGVYVPNMSGEDAAKWRAKLVGKHGGHPRAEIRKALGGTQIKIVVCPDEVAVSMNGTAWFPAAVHAVSDDDTFGAMMQAVLEASAVIMMRDDRGSPR